MSYIIVDADSIIFKAAIVATSKSEIRSNIKAAIKEIERECFMGEMKLAVKGRGNFRYSVYPEYKSNRKPLDEKVRERINYGHKYMVEYFEATMADGMEADDLVSIWCWECINEGIPFVLAHIDKDLNQIPGPHYNYNKKEHYTVTPEDGYRFLAKQWVMGDSTDGIPGVPGWGPKKTDKLLDTVGVDRLESRVRALYRKEGLSKKYCDQMYHMVYMLQSWEELYEHDPSLRCETVVSEQDVLQSEDKDEGVQGVSGDDTNVTHDGEQ